MRHQTNHVARGVGDAGDVVDRPVRVVHVAEHDPALAIEFPQGFVVTDVAAGKVVDREHQLVPDDSRTGEDADALSDHVNAALTIFGTGWSSWGDVVSFPSGRYELMLGGQTYDFVIAGAVTDPAQCVEGTASVRGPVFYECKAQ